jgi:hypothetical protein
MSRALCLDGGPFNLSESAVIAVVFNGIAFCYEM